MGSLAKILSQLTYWFYWAQASIIHWIILSKRKFQKITGIDKYSPPNGSSQSVSPLWMKTALSGYFSSVPLMEIKLHRFTGSGMMGKLSKLELIWPKGASTALPSSVIIKTVEESRYISSMLLGNAREAKFYKDFSQEVDKFGILPKIYYAEGSMTTGEYIIVMEDLSAKSIPGGHVFGNQCWGPAVIPQEFKVDPMDALEKVFLSIADVHATFWRDENLFKHKYFKATNWLQGKGRYQWELGYHTTKQKWEKIMSAVESGSSKVQWSSDYKDAMSRH
jgi:hypothetical protein